MEPTKTARRARRKARARARTKERVRQLELPLKQPRGGKRKGAGRKPKGARAGVSHKTRADLKAYNPIHVTTRIQAHLPGLRTVARRHVIESCFCAAKERFGMRIVHYSIQSNHLHLIVEAEDRHALAKGMQGLLVRIAKKLNKECFDRKGKVFADRYHAREVKSPREVRNVLLYVLRNAPKHGNYFVGVDEYSSGAWFDGWERPPSSPPGARELVTCVPPRGWKMRIGWKLHHPPIRFDEVPASAVDYERHTAPTRPPAAASP
jgi:REP element-mobilizing transposase RayT